MPGSLSNLGPGFDVLGMAVEVVNRFDAWADGPAGAFTEGGRPVDPDGHAVAVAVRACERAFGHRLAHGLAWTQEEAVPRSRGLGSSATARVAGALLWCEATGQRPDIEALLEVLAALEGHADNVAAALLGGVTAVTWFEGRLRVLRREPPPALRVVVCVPEVEVSTDAARRALPERYGRADVVVDLGALAFLMEGLATGDPTLLRIGVRDRIHHPYRAPLVGPADEVIAAAERAGAAAAFISGSGSTMAALLLPGADGAGVAEAMSAVFRRAGISCRAEVVAPSREGATVARSS